MRFLSFGITGSILSFFIATIPSLAHASTPFSGTPIRVAPGNTVTIQAVHFDQGGQNDAYYDTTGGNNGGVFRDTDVDIQASAEGGHNIGWIAQGEWLKYTLNIEQAGCFTVVARVSSPHATTSSRTLTFAGAGGSATITVPNTGGWQNFQDVTRTNLCFTSTGTQVLRATAGSSGFNFKSFQLISQASGTTPYRIVTLPGRIEAEDFDNGGQNNAYYDTTGGNNGGVYRNTDVDIQSSSEGGYNVGWIAQGEWLQYTVNVPTAGNYDFHVRVASPNSTASFDLLVNGVVVASNVGVPNTGGWQAWRTVTRSGIALSSGENKIRFRARSSGFNFNYIDVVASAPAPAPAPTPTPALTSPYRSISLPGRIEAEDFDNGGQNNAYYDTTSGNTGSAYRNTDVDIQSCSEGGYNVGWIAQGEWLQYTVNVSTARNYDFHVRVASPNSTASFDLLVNGVVVASNVGVPNTGGWQAWRTVTRSGIALSSGENKIRFRARSSGFNFNYIDVLAAASPSPTPPPTSPQPSTSGPLRVMQWNVHHGNAGVTAIANEMHASGAHVFLLNEVRDWNYQTYESEMRRLTGRAWYSLYRLGNGSDGNLILSSIPFESTQTARWRGPNTSSSCYPDRSAARAAIRHNGVVINLFVFHNDVCIDNRDFLIDRLIEFMQPTSNGPQILGGDFNAGDNQASVMKLSSTSSTYNGRFYDSWTYVTGQTGSSESSKTRNWRIDYQFFSRAYSSRVRATNIWLRNYNYTLSDHRSVVADYYVSP